MRVMVLDDHPIFRHGLALHMGQERDLEIVWEGGEPLEALAQLALLRPDVLVVDYRLPTMNGSEVVRRAKEIAPEVNVLAVSAHQDDDAVLEMVRAGSIGYVLKDSEPVELIRAVKAAARGDSFLDPVIARTVLQHFRQLEGGPAKRTTDLYDGLTEREIEVLQLVCQGASNKQVAQELTISERTVENHLRNIYQKLHISDRTQAVFYAIKKGLIAIH